MQRHLFSGVLLANVLVILIVRWLANPNPTWFAGVGSGALNEQYPASILQWREIIERNALENGLDANLVAAVMLQESNGNSDAYSHSGAVGLMQVMPRDGLAASFMCKNGPCFSKRPSMDELYDPEFNVAFACKMLAGLMNKHGNWRDALKDYGPMDRGYDYADLVLNIYEQYRQ